MEYLFTFCTPSDCDQFKLELEGFSQMYGEWDEGARKYSRDTLIEEANRYLSEKRDHQLHLITDGAGPDDKDQ